MYAGTYICDPKSPSASLRLALNKEKSNTHNISKLYSIYESTMDLHMKKATCQRASRAARASDPSSAGTMQAYNIMYEKYQQIKRERIERASLESQTYKKMKPLYCLSGKAIANAASQQDQSKINHLASLKAKDIDTNNTEPAFLLGGFTCPMKWDRLAENSLRSNAVNSSVSNQFSHIPFEFQVQYINSLLCVFVHVHQQVMRERKTQGVHAYFNMITKLNVLPICIYFV
jgi:hypothetical protein